MTERKPTTAVAGLGLARTGFLVLASGEVFEGQGFGATGAAPGEVCFNTAITGYQEILSDPSYAGQIVCFTFPHIGNTGANTEDIETATPAVRGMVVRANLTEPSNYRAAQHLDAWAKHHNIVGLSGIDTRRLTRLIREKGMPNAVIAHENSGTFDRRALHHQAREWPGLEGMDLAKEVTARQSWVLDEGLWRWPNGYPKGGKADRHIAVIDYGVKRNILRSLTTTAGRVTVVPAQTDAMSILALKPDGVVLSNGPGDPAATGVYAVPVIRTLVDSGLPIFGICLGHQMLALALGARTRKMAQGHHGANHPVKDLSTGKVEIVSMNHGFTVDRESLPAHVTETHVSLFDGTNCGIALKDRPVFSVQYHPEASPGPHDSHYLFERFASAVKEGPA